MINIVDDVLKRGETAVKELVGRSENLNLEFKTKERPESFILSKADNRIKLMLPLNCAQLLRSPDSKAKCMAALMSLFDQLILMSVRTLFNALKIQIEATC